MFVYIQFIVISLIAKIAISERSENFLKCCDDESILNDKFKCTKNFVDHFSNGTFTESLLNMANKTRMMYTVCLKNGEGGNIAEENATRYGTNDTCVDVLANGTKVRLFCDSEMISLNDTHQHCDSLFTQLHFWGATIVVFATIIYNIPFIIVVIIYCSFPELRYRAYDRAVMSYNVSYMMINFLLIIFGCYDLCHVRLSITAIQMFSLAIMFWTQGAVIWLLIICFDITLVITRFRWAPKGGAERGREERRKCLIYAAWGWGFSALLTVIAAIVEFSPIFPEDSPIRPNFHQFKEPNVAVIVYVITGPVLICLTNTSLFIYTTVKTIAVQKSTAIINENRKTNVKKKYFVFLKLYLVMDTPWVTGALGAIFPDLWILKFIKMVQPIVIIILIVPRKRLLQAIRCSQAEPHERETVRLNNKSGKEVNLPAAKKIDPAASC